MSGRPVAIGLAVLAAQDQVDRIAEVEFQRTTNDGRFSFAETVIAILEIVFTIALTELYVYLCREFS